MTSSPLCAERLIQDPAYPALKRHVIQSTGLAFYIEKDVDFASRVSARLSELELGNCAEYLRLLSDRQKGEVERRRLIAQLTIGETYFFRHSEQFDALRDVILPDLISRNASGRSLRIWSAGCATGAEPYSIAILLKQEFSHQLAGWDIRIIATDINEQFLERAKLGRFEDWAMRATPDAQRNRWFSKDGKFWVLTPECMDWISFHYHNLVDDPFPSLLHDLVSLDLIVCRNVMIYFDWNLIRKIINKFHDCLVDRGWLVVGHAEVNIDIFRPYRTVNVEGAVLYQKDALRAGSIDGFPWKPSADNFVPPSSVFDATTTWTPPVLPPIPTGSAPEAHPPEKSIESIAGIRQLADQGRWKEALEQCEEALFKKNLNPAIHFLRGLILDQMGRAGESEQAMRRVIYLDRTSVLGHYHLALLLQKRGDRTSALQSLKNAQRILARVDKTVVFEEADGMTAGELQDVIKIQMGLMAK